MTRPSLLVLEITKKISYFSFSQDEKTKEPVADIKPPLDAACSSSNTLPVKMEHDDDEDESSSKVSSKMNSSNENPTVKIMGMDVAG